MVRTTQNVNLLLHYLTEAFVTSTPVLHFLRTEYAQKFEASGEPNVRLDSRETSRSSFNLSPFLFFLCAA
jgi:hypothetical protein